MRNIGESVRDKLRCQAKVRGIGSEALLEREAMERFLHRVSLSAYRDEFALKGALLSAVWEGDLSRSTRDVDLQELGEPRDVVSALKEIARIEPSDRPDGIVFDVATARVKRLFPTGVGGERVTMTVHVGNAQVPLRLDVAYGLPMPLEPEALWYPPLLPGYAPFRILALPRESMVAEKLATMVEFGADNTKLWDYYDIWHLSRRHAFEGDVLALAVRSICEGRAAAGFLRRDDGYWEAGLADSYATGGRRNAWVRWIEQRAPQDEPPTLMSVLRDLREFCIPLLKTVASQDSHGPGRWLPTRGWLPQRLSERHWATRYTVDNDVVPAQRQRTGQRGMQPTPPTVNF